MKIFKKVTGFTLALVMLVGMVAWMPGMVVPAEASTIMPVRSISGSIEIRSPNVATLSRGSTYDINVIVSGIMNYSHTNIYVKRGAWDAAWSNSNDTPGWTNQTGTNIWREWRTTSSTPTGTYTIVAVAYDNRWSDSFRVVGYRTINLIAPVSDNITVSQFPSSFTVDQGQDLRLSGTINSQTSNLTRVTANVQFYDGVADVSATPNSRSYNLNGLTLKTASLSAGTYTIRLWATNSANNGVLVTTATLTVRALSETGPTGSGSVSVSGTTLNLGAIVNTTGNLSSIGVIGIEWDVNGTIYERVNIDGWKSGSSESHQITVPPGTYTVRVRFTTDWFGATRPLQRSNWVACSGSPVTVAQNTVTITWNYNGGTGSPSSSTLTPGTPFGALPTPNVRSTHDFIGWFTDDTDGTQIFPLSPVPHSNTTYWARWNPISNPIDIRAYDLNVLVIGTTVAVTGRYPNGVETLEFAVMNRTTGARSPATGYNQVDNVGNGGFSQSITGLSPGEYHVAIRTTASTGVTTADGRPNAYAEHNFSIATSPPPGGTGGNLRIETFSRANDWNHKLSDNFYVREFACRCGCPIIPISMLLVDVLEELRRDLNNREIIIRSGYRCRTYNSSPAISSSDGSFHTFGTAVDILLSNNTATTRNEVYDKARAILNNRGILSPPRTGTVRVNSSHATANWLYMGSDFVHLGVGRTAHHPVAARAGEIGVLAFDVGDILTGAQERQTFTVNFDPTQASISSVRVSSATDVLVTMGADSVLVEFTPLTDDVSVDVTFGVPQNAPAHTEIPITLFNNFDVSQSVVGVISVLGEESNVFTTPGILNGIQLTAEVTPIGILFDWTPSDNTHGYRIYRSTTPGGEGLSISDFPLTGSSFFDANVDSDRTYYYTIAAVLEEAHFDMATVILTPEVVGARSEELVLTTTVIRKPETEDEEEEPRFGFIMMTIGNPFMIVNEETLEIDPGRSTAPMAVSGRTMVPIRAIIEAMSGNALWESGNPNRITLQKKDITIIMNLGSKDITVNGEPKEMDVAPFISNDRTLLPVRFVADNIGAEIEWIGSTQRVVIVYALEG
jgi:hypothetical protein